MTTVPEQTMFCQQVVELGGAKMYSGLSTEAFLKKPTVQTLTREGIEELSKTVIPIAEYEGFYAHANSVKVRLNKK